MPRWPLALLPLAGLCASCKIGDSAGNKPREEKKAVSNPMDEAAIRKLFDEAAACGNRYKCPPGDQLMDMSEKSGTDVLTVRVAFKMMLEPAVRFFDREGRLAEALVRNFVVARRKGRGFDSEAKTVFFDCATAL